MKIINTHLALFFFLNNVTLISGSRKIRRLKSEKRSKRGSKSGSKSGKSTASEDFTTYERVLWNGPDMDNTLDLFALLEGEEHRRHIHDFKKKTGGKVGICHNPRSKYDSMRVTHAECFDLDNEHLSSVSFSSLEHTLGSEASLMASPQGVESTLLASNPGIWSVANFISEDELDQILQMVEKYGTGHGLWGPCKNVSTQPIDAHPVEGKGCFKISPESACEAPHELFEFAECDRKTDPADSIFVADLISRFESMWPDLAHLPVNPFLMFQRSEGGTPPVDLHSDHFFVTILLYLSDGGASTVFPRANVTITPEKGMATTFLNYDENGDRKPHADHAVQAHPANAGERLVMLFSLELDEGGILETH